MVLLDTTQDQQALVRPAQLVFPRVEMRIMQLFPHLLDTHLVDGVATMGRTVAAEEVAAATTEAVEAACATLTLTRDLLAAADRHGTAAMRYRQSIPLAVKQVGGLLEVRHIPLGLMALLH